MWDIDMEHFPDSSPPVIQEEDETRSEQAPIATSTPSPPTCRRPLSQPVLGTTRYHNGPESIALQRPPTSLTFHNYEIVEERPVSACLRRSRAPTPDVSPNTRMRRVSRSGVHPMLGAGLAIREAFGPRIAMLEQSYERAPEAESPPPVRDTVDMANHSQEFVNLEDSMGGLPGVFSAEEQGALPDTETLLFRDGKRRIDMVLVYEEEDYGVMTLAEVTRRDMRRVFQENLMKEGLELEIEEKQMAFDQEKYFVKIHVPWKALTRYAEVMNMKMPIKGAVVFALPMGSSLVVCPVRVINSGIHVYVKRTEENRKFPTFHRWLACERHPTPASQMYSGNIQNDQYHLREVLKGHEEVGEDVEKKHSGFLPPKLKKIFEYDHKRIAKEPSFYTASYRQDREEQFIIKDRETFFTAAQRSQVVWQIMMRAKYDESEKVGIRRLLNNGTYLASFPLHEGSYNVDSPTGVNLDRRLLYTEWARPSKWYKKQPLWLIKKYFGDKIGLYFAWLGFYTKMLIPASVVGLLCFFYGLLSMNSTDNIPSMEICDPNVGGNITMCPLCDKVCTYQKLYTSCVFAKITYLFDNPATVFFAIFMSFWATTFLELWKRRQAVIVWEWDLQHVEEDEEPRPEFETSVKTFRTNPVTMEKEPYLPTWSKAWRFLATTSAVLFMVVVVLGAVLGTIVYRISVVTVIYGSRDQFLKKHAKIFTSITAAVINLVLIMILTKIYQRLALWLTNLENPRTQTEYEDSYTFKIFVFQFVNFYSSLIYIAFFKGRFFVHPGDTSARSSAFTRLKIDVCDPAGCLSELCIQLSIIMVGKQLLNNFLEILYPKMYNWWSKRVHRSNTKNLDRKYTRWEEDFQLQDPGRLALFEEYLEMVLQYGFVTLFVAAFPLAPLFALINNVGEIRLDAYKMVTQARRPLAERVQDIGAWYGVLQGVTYAAVVSNAFVIAYTSDFIPRMVYKYVYSPTDTLKGYIDSSLSEFDTSDYREDMKPDEDPPGQTCQYRGYRNGPNHADKYDLSPQYWHVFAARLAFVVVFEHIVFALTGIMAYVIPDVPVEVRTQIQREKLLEKEAKYEHGTQGNMNDNYGEMLLQQRERSIAAAAGAARSWWARRLSRVSDNTDSQPKGYNASSTVWEVPR